MSSNLFWSKRRKPWWNVLLSFVLVLILEAKLIRCFYIPQNNLPKNENPSSERIFFYRDNHPNQTPNHRPYRKNYDLEGLATTVKTNENRNAFNTEVRFYLPDHNSHYRSGKKMTLQSKQENSKARRRFREIKQKNTKSSISSYTPNPLPFFYLLPPLQTNVTSPLSLNNSFSVSTRNPSALVSDPQSITAASKIHSISMSANEGSNRLQASPSNFSFRNNYSWSESMLTRRNVKMRSKIDDSKQKQIFSSHPYASYGSAGHADACDRFLKSLSINDQTDGSSEGNSDPRNFRSGKNPVTLSQAGGGSERNINRILKKKRKFSIQSLRNHPFITAVVRELIPFNLRVEDSSNKIVYALKPTTLYQVVVTSFSPNVSYHVFLSIKESGKFDVGDFDEERPGHRRCSRSSLVARTPVVFKWSFQSTRKKSIEFRVKSDEINYSQTLILPVNTEKESVFDISSGPARKRRKTNCAFNYFTRLTPSLASWHLCAEDQNQETNDNEANRRVWEKVTEKLLKESVPDEEVNSKLEYNNSESNNSVNDKSKIANIAKYNNEGERGSIETQKAKFSRVFTILDKIKRSVVISDDAVRYHIPSEDSISRHNYSENNLDIKRKNIIQNSVDNNSIAFLLKHNVTHRSPSTFSATNFPAEESSSVESELANITNSENKKLNLEKMNEKYLETTENFPSEEDEGDADGSNEVQQPEKDEFSKGCDSGWIPFQDLCFHLVEQESNWGIAEETCRQMGGHLASVTSSGAAQLLNSMIMKLPISPSSAFWIGASDDAFENAFAWTSGKPFGYADWFPGWSDQDGYSSQPSDDGLADEDCVELRRSFKLATKGSRITPRFYWNDRNCDVENYFICENRIEGETNSVDEWTCNTTRLVTPGAPPTIITSPGFPSSYSPGLTCITKLEAPPPSTITLVFDAFHMEGHSNCSFDSLEIMEPEVQKKKVVCGDWTPKLKLLRYISANHQIVLSLKTDPAHSFAGFKIRAIASTGGGGCGTRWQTRHEDTCLFAADDPQVTWHTATRICREAQGELVKLGDEASMKWINSWLHEHPRFSPDFRFWIGGSFYSGSWIWEDQSPVSKEVTEKIISEVIPEPDLRLCLSIEASTGVRSISDQQRYYHKYPAKNNLLPTSHFCDSFGGYICAKKVEEKVVVQNRTIFGTAGNVTSPEFPDRYPDDIHMTLTLKGPTHSRLILTLRRLSLEYQKDCLYDYVGLSSDQDDKEMKRFCGHQTKEDESPVYVSKSNELFLTFHSDWSENGAGMVADWWSVDTSGCPLRIANLSDPVVASPNFPHFILADLTCTTIIEAPVGHKIWLQFEVFEVTNEESDSEMFSDNDFTEIDEMKRSARGIKLSADNNIQQYISMLESNISPKPISKPILGSGTPLDPLQSIKSILKSPFHSSKFSSPLELRRHHGYSDLASLYPSRHNQKHSRNLDSKLNPASTRLKRRSRVNRGLTSTMLPSSSTLTLFQHYSSHTSPLLPRNTISSTPRPKSVTSAHRFLPGSHPASDKPNQQCTDDFVEIILAGEKSIKLCGIIPKEEMGTLAYISHGNILKIALHTSKRAKGRGFRAKYKIGLSFDENVILTARNSPSARIVASSANEDLFNPKVHRGEIRPLNYPQSSTDDVRFARHLVAPSGFRLNLMLYHIGEIADQGKSCPEDYLEVEDWYAGREGKTWRICSIDPNSSKKISIQSSYNSIFIKEVYLSSDSKRLENDHQEAITNDSKVVVFHPNLTTVSDDVRRKFSGLSTSGKVTENISGKEDGEDFEAFSETNDAPERVGPAPETPESKLQQDRKLLKVDHSKIMNASFTDARENSVESNGRSISLKSKAKGRENSIHFGSNSRNNANQGSTSVFTNRFKPTFPSNSPSSTTYPITISSAAETNSISEDERIRNITNLVKDRTEELQQRKQKDREFNNKETSKYREEEAISKVPTILNFKITYYLIPDSDWINRSMGLFGEDSRIRRTGVASCSPSPCLSGGHCVTDSLQQSTCHCSPAYTGTFCQVEWCFSNPCAKGQCILTGSPKGYECKCQVGWGGPLCNQKVSPCSGEPCQGRGECVAINNTFNCRCHAWWEGTRCERRLQRIPYKPLSERMIEEPFWLGLITVAVVMGCIGIVFCIKKHFADKIEKFFAEEIERSKFGGGAGGSSSPLRALSKPRSQNSSPRIDSKKILRHLIAPPVGHRAPSFDEFLNLRTQSSKCSVERTRSADISELRAMGSLPIDRRTSEGDSTSQERETSLICLAPSPTKQDKKVTFAKLMNKMQKELSSSSSDMSAAEDKARNIALVAAARRSPRRSPRLRHTPRYSGSGSEEIMETPDISSSEMTPDPQKRLLTIKSASSPSSKTSSPQNRSKLMKISSADSLLAMFRSLGGNSRSSISSPTSPHGSEVDDSSAHGSPSTTPTTPPRTSPVPNDTLTVPGDSHQIQVHGQAGSSQSQSPSITLEVPTEQYRCLSPITELPSPMPTPMPSPLPTPSKYHMHQGQKPLATTSSDSSAQDNNTTEDTESEFSISVSIERSSSDSSGSEPRAFFSVSRNRGGISPNMKKDPMLSPSAKISFSSSGSSPSPTPTSSPLASPKTKTKPPPLCIPNSNLLNFNTRTNSSLLIPVIRIQDADGDILSYEHFDSTPRTRSQSVDVGSVLKTPLITICCVDDSPPSSSSSSSKSDPSTASFIVPTLSVTIDSPPAINKLQFVIPSISIEKQYESPVPKMFKTPNPPFRRRSHNQIISLEKASSLDNPQAPMITVTAVMSEADSDLDTPLEKTAPHTGTARFLSPLLAANIHTTSEGNLSSSGYSSAYSPGPSRCSSNNRLCSVEGEEPMTPSVTSIPSKPAILRSQNLSSSTRIKQRPLLVKSTHMNESPAATVFESSLIRTDSETTDDLGGSSQPEQDSALEVDTNDEFQETRMINSIIHGLTMDEEVEAQRQRLLISSSQSFPKESPRLQRSPPAIVVHSSLQSESSVEDNVPEKPSKLSPVSSRSESPISDSRLSVRRIYPAFFSSKGKLDMPYTDSDGLYDCPSSEVLHSDSAKSAPLRRLGRRKTKRASKLKNLLGVVGSGESPGKSAGGHIGNCSTNKRGSSLELPPWEHRSPRRSSQKRRQRTQTSADLLSSSSDSVTSRSATIGCRSPVEILSDIGCLEIGDDDSGEANKSSNRSSYSRGRRRRPLVRGESISCKSLTRQGSFDASGEETQEEQVVIRSSKGSEEWQRHRKLSRFRSFSNQLRFIRRLQQSRVKREQLMSPSGSSDSDPDYAPPEIWLKKSSTPEPQTFGGKLKETSKIFQKNSKKEETKYKMVGERKVRSS